MFPFIINQRSKAFLNSPHYSLFTESILPVREWRQKVDHNFIETSGKSEHFIGGIGKAENLIETIGKADQTVSN